MGGETTRLLFSVPHTYPLIPTVPGPYTAPFLVPRLLPACLWATCHPADIPACLPHTCYPPQPEPALGRGKERRPHPYSYLCCGGLLPAQCCSFGRRRQFIPTIEAQVGLLGTGGAPTHLPTCHYLPIGSLPRSCHTHYPCLQTTTYLPVVLIPACCLPAFFLLLRAFSPHTWFAILP